MVYFHPWEIDPDQPRIAGTWRSRFRHYQNLASTEKKLLKLLKNFSFSTMEEVLANYELRTYPEVDHNAPKRFAHRAPSLDLENS